MAYSDIQNHNPVHVNAALDAVFEPIRLNLRLLIDLVHVWIERDRQRQALARMSDRDLRDLGVTRATAAYEFEKPFWQG